MSGGASGDPGRPTDRLAYADLIRRWRDSDRILLTGDDASLSYADCARRGDQLARALLGAGLERPARVAVVLPNSPEFVIALYACARIGVTLVPISTWSRPAELKRILGDAKAELVLAKEAFVGHGIVKALREACAGDAALSGIKAYEWSDAPGVERPLSELLALASRCDEEKWARASNGISHADADLAILYTSGSTGLPKGVMLRQSSVARNGANIATRMGFGGDDRLFSYFPMFFSGGLCNALTGALSCGAELVTQARFDPVGALALIRSRRCTGRNLWHDGLEPIAAVPGFQASDLRQMRRGLYLDPEFYKRLGLPTDEGVNMYGMTETATAFTCGDFREPAAVRQSTHGTPFPGSELRIVKPDSASPLAVGVEGEICVRGYNLMRGYTDGSERERMDEDGYFHSGDVGYLDADGYLHFVGRRKTLIKVKGLTVQPEEVEATLMRHPDVAKAVVLGQGEGSESTAVAALVVLKAGAARDLRAIEAYCREQLSSYKVPRVLAIAPDSFPLSASLKIDRIGAAALLRSMTAQEGDRDR